VANSILSPKYAHFVVCLAAACIEHGHRFAVNNESALQLTGDARGNAQTIIKWLDQAECDGLLAIERREINRAGEFACAVKLLPAGVEFVRHPAARLKWAQVEHSPEIAAFRALQNSITPEEKAQRFAEWQAALDSRRNRRKEAANA
jgi:hypothetical protein